MKKVIVALVVLLFCVPAQATISTWVWGEDDAINARVGTFLTENNEAGISFKWRDDDSEPRQIGFFAVYHFPEPVQFRNPLPVEFLPETISGTGYLGIKYDRDLDLDTNTTDPIAGIIFEDTLFIEYGLSGTALMGIRIKF